MRWRELVKKGIILSALAFVAVGAALSVVQAKEMVFQGKTYDIAEPGEIIPGEVVVQMKPGASIQQARDVASSVAGQVVRAIPRYNIYLVRMSPGAQGAAASEQVGSAVGVARQNPDVRGAFPNYKLSIPKPVGAVEPLQSGPGVQAAEVREGAEAASQAVAQAVAQSAPVGNQWHLDAINYNYAGSLPLSTPVVAVVDTGVEYDHPDLAGNVILGRDFVDDDMDPADENGHGTHVAGIIAAKGTYMVRGVSPTSKVLAVRVLNRAGSGSWFNIMAGIVYARSQSNVKVINMSLGGFMEESADVNSDFMIFKKVLDDTLALGVIPVVSAGNDDNYTLYQYQSSYKYRPVPAWFPSSYTVGATEEVDMRARFSNYDVGTLNSMVFNYNFVDIVAPGWNVLSSYLGGQVMRLSGTSMASPVVAGCVARYWGAHPTATAAAVQSALVTTGKVVNVYNGFPTPARRVSLMKALGQAQTGFVGVVYNGQTASPLSGATVRAKQGTTVLGTATTNREGFFSLTGLTGGQKYTLNVAKTGFAVYNVAATAVADTMTTLTSPVFLNQNRASGEWSVLIDWRSWHPGYGEATTTYPSRPAWFPYNWDGVAGACFVPYVSSSLTTVSPDNLGSLSTWPYMALTHWPYDDYRSGECFVIKPQTGVTYKVYTLLDSIISGYYCWGKYKTTTNVTQPLVQARVYLAGALKATVKAAGATGTGAYWHVANITDGVVTVVNKLQDVAP